MSKIVEEIKNFEKEINDVINEYEKISNKIENNILKEITEDKTRFKINKEEFFKKTDNKIIYFNFNLNTIDTNVNFYKFTDYLQRNPKYKNKIMHSMIRYEREIENHYRNYMKYCKEIENKYNNLLNKIKNMNEYELEEIVKNLDLTYYELGPNENLQKEYIILLLSPTLIVDDNKNNQRILIKKDIPFREYLLKYLGSLIKKMKYCEIIKLNDNLKFYNISYKF